MPNVVLGHGGDQDESGLGPALKKSNGRTDPHIDGQGVQRRGSPGESFFGFGGSRKSFQRRDDWS